MWNIAPLILSTILKDFFISFIVESKILRNHWPRNYFVKLVDRGECKIIGTRLTMFGRQFVKFFHKRTLPIFSLLAFGEWWFLSLCIYQYFMIMVTHCMFCNSDISSWLCDPTSLSSTLLNAMLLCFYEIRIIYWIP